MEGIGGRGFRMERKTALQAGGGQGRPEAGETGEGAGLGAGEVAKGTAARAAILISIQRQDI